MDGPGALTTANPFESDAGALYKETFRGGSGCSVSDREMSDRRGDEDIYIGQGSDDEDTIYDVSEERGPSDSTEAGEESRVISGGGEWV